jgi:hypothetical protein
MIYRDSPILSDHRRRLNDIHGGLLIGSHTPDYTPQNRAKQGRLPIPATTVAGISAPAYGVRHTDARVGPQADGGEAPSLQRRSVRKSSAFPPDIACQPV